MNATATNTGNISNRAMLSSLNIKTWSASRFDRDATKAVASIHNTAEDVGRYNKSLVAKDALKALKSIANDARTAHYDLSLPWAQDGARILPSAVYLKYSKEIAKFKNAFESEVKKFVAVYPTLIAEAKIRLNGLFKPEDYPAPAEIEAQFGFESAIIPLPTAGDFRVNLADAEIGEIKKQIDKRANEAIESAQKSLHDRIVKTVSHAVDKLGSYKVNPDGTKKNIFRDTLVSNISDLVEILPALNIGEDPALDSIAAEMREKLTKISPQELRENEGARVKVAGDAKAILDKMKGYISQ